MLVPRELISLSLILAHKVSELQQCDRLTRNAAPHVGPQVLSIRAGAGVLGRVFRDLRRLETQVLTAAVGHAAQVAAVWAWRWRHQKK